MKLKKLSKTAMALALVCAMSFNASTAFAVEKTGSGTTGGYSFVGYLNATSTQVVGRTTTANSRNFAYLDVDLTVTYKETDSRTVIEDLPAKYKTNDYTVEKTYSEHTPILAASSVHMARYQTSSSTGRVDLSIKLN